MNPTAALALLQAGRNQAIALVQIFEAAIELLDGSPRPAGPTCERCGAGGLLTAGAMHVCPECNHNQPAT